MLINHTTDGDTLGAITNATEEEGLLTNLAKPIDNFVEKLLYPFAKLSDLKRTQSITSKQQVLGVMWCRSDEKVSAMYKVKKVVAGIEKMFLGSTLNRVAAF